MSHGGTPKMHFFFARTRPTIRQLKWVVEKCVRQDHGDYWWKTQLQPEGLNIAGLATLLLA